MYVKSLELQIGSVFIELNIHRFCISKHSALGNWQCRAFIYVYAGHQEVVDFTPTLSMTLIIPNFGH